MYCVCLARDSVTILSETLCPAGAGVIRAWDEHAGQAAIIRDLFWRLGWACCVDRRGYDILRLGIDGLRIHGGKHDVPWCAFYEVGQGLGISLVVYIARA